MKKIIAGSMSALVIMVVVFISSMLILCLAWAAAQSFILFENHFYIYAWHPLERAGVLIGSVTGLAVFIWKIGKI